MSLKSFLTKIPIIAFLSMVVLFKTNASAADTVWQNDYEYKLFDPNYLSGMSKANIEALFGTEPLIQLHRYKGNETIIRIPATATVYGETYKTYLGNLYSNDKDNSIPFFENAPEIESISFEDGCIMNRLNFVTNCTSLKTLDFTGSVGFLRGHVHHSNINDCPNLEYINYYGVIFVGERNNLKNCKSLKRITTPAEIPYRKDRSDHEKTLLPYAMFVYKDSTYTGKPYLYLEDAPPNTLIAAKEAVAKPDKSIIKYNNLKYRVLSSGRKEVELMGPIKKCPSKLIIDDTITDENGTIYRVKSIAKKAFYRNKQLENLKIYNDGITIKSKAFADCPKLKKVFIEDHNAVLKPQAFKSSGIKKVTFYGAYVFTIDLIIGKEAFKDCTKLSEIVFDGLWRMNMKKTIKKNCFKGIKSKAMVRFTGAEGPGLPLEHFKDFHPKGKAIVKYINKFGGASDAKPKLPTG